MKNKNIKINDFKNTKGKYYFKIMNNKLLIYCKKMNNKKGE